ncbi:MAG: DUF1028 domain-containing protein [Rhodobacteraceae bacterium]|nr:DUF1028 domain-containing protein [Paracoccaceae bacterium]
MTFAIAGRCEMTGNLGVAITTSSICVGSRCPWVQSGVGAVSTQNVTLPSIGLEVLGRIESGCSAAEALGEVMERAPYPEYRQVIGIDNLGRTASFEGDSILGTNAVAADQQCIAAGNLLKSSKLPSAMTAFFAQKRDLSLAERLLQTLEHGLYEMKGEEGTVHSAALLVADMHPWPTVDLRVDWDDRDPVAALRELWVHYEPQAEDYILRAMHPYKAPSYGVPGDE